MEHIKNQFVNSFWMLILTKLTVKNEVFFIDKSSRIVIFTKTKYIFYSDKSLSNT